MREGDLYIKPTDLKFEGGFGSPVAIIMIGLFFALPAVILSTNQETLNFYYARSARDRLKQQAEYFSMASVAALRAHSVCKQNMLHFGLIGKDFRKIHQYPFKPHFRYLLSEKQLREVDFTSVDGLGFLLKDIHLESSNLEYVSKRSDTSVLFKMKMKFSPRESHGKSAKIDVIKTTEILMLVETDSDQSLKGNCIFTKATDQYGTLLEDRTCQTLRGLNYNFEMKTYSCVPRQQAGRTRIAGEEIED
jgi:hypothetical protein